jgi:hypothetical protein
MTPCTCAGPFLSAILVSHHVSSLVAIVFLWLAVVSYGAGWNLRRKRRARENIRAALQQADYQVVEMSYRYWRTGPFSIWTTSRLHFVFRVLVRQVPGGERSVWARWGRPCFTGPDTLELDWDTP